VIFEENTYEDRLQCLIGSCSIPIISIIKKKSLDVLQEDVDAALYLCGLIAAIWYRTAFFSGLVV